MSEIPTELFDRILFHLEWMITDLTYRQEDIGIEEKYSDELKDAIELYKQLTN